MREFCRRLGGAGIDLALITDDDNVYYLTGYYDYLHMEFGRPTILAVGRDGSSVLITPAMEMPMAAEVARVDRLVAWNDGLDKEWHGELVRFMAGVGRVALEPDDMPSVVRRCVDDHIDPAQVADAAAILADMRMIKSAEELQLARHAGQVAGAMMNAGRAAIGAGVAEFEVAIATSEAGARESAKLLAAHYDDANMSPNTHFLQIMASGEQIVKPHHRASTKVMQSGEPVFLCFCGMTNFHRFKLGFDRTFWIGEVTDPQQAEIYEVAVASQAAALSVLRAGVVAEEVHAAYAEVIQSAGYDYPFRCGRATGYSFLEKPELVVGDKTVLKPGMVFAVDGSVSARRFRAQVGDSFIVNNDGYEQITHHAKTLEDMIL